MKNITYFEKSLKIIKKIAVVCAFFIYFYYFLNSSPSFGNGSGFVISDMQMRSFVENKMFSFYDEDDEVDVILVNHPPFHISVTGEFSLINLIAKDIGRRTGMSSNDPIFIMHPNDHLLKKNPSFEELRDMYIVFATGRQREEALRILNFGPDPNNIANINLGCRSRTVWKAGGPKFVTFVIVDRAKLSVKDLRICFLSRFLSLTGLRKSEQEVNKENKIFGITEPKEIDFFAFETISKYRLYGKIKKSEIIDIFMKYSSFKDD